MVNYLPALSISKKGYDSIKHKGLFHILSTNQVNGNIIQSMYKNSSSAVKLGNRCTQFFLCSKGLRQGCPLSPNLFNIYVNDLFKRLNSVDTHPLCLNNEQITALMYADYLIILSLSNEGFQTCLDELNRYCNEWSLKADNEKTKCIKCLKVSKLYNISFNIGNTALENVKEFTYLGITIIGAGSFQPAMRDLSDKASRAIFSLNSRYKLNKLPLNIAFKLFDTMIMPILFCGSEVWRAYEYNPTKTSDEWGKRTIEAVQTQFIKHLIGVNKSTTNIMVRGETGRYPLSLFIKLRTVKFVIAYEYKNSILNSNTQMGLRPNICYFLSDRDKCLMMNCSTVWKC